jgi:hypothetical protein
MVFLALIIFVGPVPVPVPVASLILFGGRVGAGARCRPHKFAESLLRRPFALSIVESITPSGGALRVTPSQSAC